MNDRTAPPSPRADRRERPQLKPEHVAALWSVAVAGQGIGARVANNLQLAHLGTSAAATSSIPGLADAVATLLASSPAASGVKASRPARAWAFAALYDQYYRFARPSAVPEITTALRSLADDLGVELPHSGSATPSSELLVQAGQATGKCTPAFVNTTSCFYPRPAGRVPYSRVSAAVEINRPLSDLSEAMDPRNWKSCIGPPFIESYQAADNGHSGETPHMKLPRYNWVKPRGASGPVDGIQKHPSVGPLGLAWGGLLYEEFEVAKSGWRFKNVLVVDYAPTASSLTLRYEQLANDTIYSSTPFPGLLIVNCGETVATAHPTDPGRSIVEGYKEVAIDDMTPGNLGGANDLGMLLRLLSAGLLSLWFHASNDFGLCCGTDQDE